LTLKRFLSPSATIAKSLIFLSPKIAKRLALRKIKDLTSVLLPPVFFRAALKDARMKEHQGEMARRQCFIRPTYLHFDQTFDRDERLRDATEKNRPNVSDSCGARTTFSIALPPHAARRPAFQARFFCNGIVDNAVHW
jgi:hypothetical protein